MTDTHELSSPPQRSADLTRSADIAEAIASTFEHVAANYKRVAHSTRSPEAATRLLGHAVRLEQRAEHERAEADRLRTARTTDD